MRQRRWLEFIKDYDLKVHYHPGKPNVVADALSRKSHCHCLSVEVFSNTLCWEMRKLNLEIVPQGSLNHVTVEPILQDSIVMAQLHDKGVKIIKQQLAQGEEKYKCFQEDPKGILWFNGCMVVPKNHQLRKQIMDEAHLSKFAMHPGSTNIYQDLKQNFWWTRMKREIAKYVSEYDICQRVKASHLRTSSTLQPLPIPSWKWEDISMGSDTLITQRDTVIDFLQEQVHELNLNLGQAIDHINMLHEQPVQPVVDEFESEEEEEDPKEVEGVSEIDSEHGDPMLSPHHSSSGSQSSVGNLDDF
jgi:hypothetical protein